MCACAALIPTVKSFSTDCQLEGSQSVKETSAGTDIHTLARQMGTSAGTIEWHYSKLTATVAADRLA